MERQEGAGTLFLDGIDELDLDCQRVLLAMVQEREITSGGKMGFRLISTTTRNIDKKSGWGDSGANCIFGSTACA